MGKSIIFRFSKCIVIFFIIAICLLATLFEQNFCYAALILDGQLLDHQKKLSAECQYDLAYLR